MPCPVETAVVAGKQTEPAEVARSEGDGACWRLGVVAAAAEAGPPMAEDGRAMDPGTAKLVAPLAGRHAGNCRLDGHRRHLQAQDSKSILLTKLINLSLDGSGN